MSTSQPTPTGAFHVYDTTLRDGAQQEGLNLSVADKLGIARQLDALGVGYIEGGWPGANPKDTEFFRRAAGELDLRTRRWRPSAPPGGPASRPPTTRWSRRCATAAPSVVTLVAKSHDRHVELALRTTLEENLAMVRDTVAHLRAEGQRVFLDAEHFFDGYRDNRDYALEVLRTAFDAGAEVVALCDTNGGMLPGWVGDVVDDVLEHHRRAGRHPLPQRHRLRGGQHARRGGRRRHPRAGHPQRLRRAHRQRRPGLGGRQPRAQARPPGAARGPAARGDPDRARGRRGHELPARVAPAVRRGQRVRAQGRAARQRDQGRPEPLPAHGARAWSATTCGCWSPTWPAARSIELKGAELGFDLRRRPRSWSPGSPTGSRTWSRAATRSRRPTRRSSCCCSRRSRVPARRTSASSRGG